MKRFLTTLTMLAITVMLVGCTQQDDQVQKATDDGGATVISEADESAKPVDQQVAKPVIPDSVDEASTETGEEGKPTAEETKAPAEETKPTEEETKAPAEDTESSSAAETDKNV